MISRPVLLLAISSLAAAGCSEEWTGQVCEETSKGIDDCDGRILSGPNASFTLHTGNPGNQSFHLDSRDPLSGYKGLTVKVRGSLANGTIHVTSFKRENNKDALGKQGGMRTEVTPGSSTPSGTETSIPLLTNTTVENLKKRGVEDDTVIDFIHKADRVRFDFQEGAVANLSQAGVDHKVVAAMKERASADQNATKPANE